MPATATPTTIDDARVRTLAFNASVMADQILGLRARLQEISDELYPLLQIADPTTDRALELFLVHLCRSLNELHNAHAMKFRADLLQRFRMPPAPAQVPQGMQTPATEIVPA